MFLSDLSGSMKVRGGSALPAEVPESALQPEFVEQLVSLVLSRPLPIVIEAAGIPFLRQLPARLDRHEVAFRHLSPRQPPVEVILRPEGENRRSGKADVVPEPSGRDYEVNDPVRRHRPARADRQREPLAALSTPARGVRHGIPA